MIVFEGNRYGTVGDIRHKFSRPLGVALQSAWRQIQGHAGIDRKDHIQARHPPLSTESAMKKTCPANNDDEIVPKSMKWKKANNMMGRAYLIKSYVIPILI